MSDASNISESMLERILNLLVTLDERQQHLEALLNQKMLMPAEMEAMNHHFRRNFLPNDSAVAQKNIMEAWLLQRPELLNHQQLVQSGFRVFSQNDEDGILLRIFCHIGSTNRFVIEVGSNCSGSDVGIPENISSNLIVNHGWHGLILEVNAEECSRMHYFFARDHSTRHFHWRRDGENTYFSPIIVEASVSPENINELLVSSNCPDEPDLMIIDIDGGDYAVMGSLTVARPRVVVVEFEKRFRDRYSVVQFDRENFSQRWEQSGAASLQAWQKLMSLKGYVLCAISSSGFNAFFVRSDVATGKLMPLQVAEAFDTHPIFSRLVEEFWLLPDETWQVV
ncbi:hypothetical protein C8247_03640 [Paracidovorax avenae]|nr:hypothetical protein C8247_03640 [Paracidovorax avenae]